MVGRQWSSVDFNSSMNVEIASCLFLGYEKNSLGGDYGVAVLEVLALHLLD